MIEVGSVGSPPRVTRFKVERNDLRAAISWARANQDAELLAELQLEYAEKCETLGYWYRQEGCKTIAKCEFIEASQARRDAALNYHNIRYRTFKEVKQIQA